jgi:hypothetical protein
MDLSSKQIYQSCISIKQPTPEDVPTLNAVPGVFLPVC